MTDDWLLLAVRRICLAAAVLWLASCHTQDPRPEDAQWLLAAATKKRAAESCALEGFLASKPEFAALRGVRFCDPQVTITRIHAVAADERLVEYDLVRTWNRAAIDQWLAALDKLEIRLLALRPDRRLEQPAVGPPQTRFLWTDPTDGALFAVALGGNLLAAAEPPPSITSSDEWHAIQASKAFTAEVARRGRNTAEPLEAVLRRVGTGWEVTVVARSPAQPLR